jgi:hypothetical protein
MKMGYAASLAKDRDKYLAQRNILAAHLSALLDAYSTANPAGDAPILKNARAALDKIYGSDKSAEQLLARIR